MDCLEDEGKKGKNSVAQGAAGNGKYLTMADAAG